MVQWDGMDSEDQEVVCVWHVPLRPVVYHGTVGCLIEFHSAPWYTDSGVVCGTI